MPAGVLTFEKFNPQKRGRYLKALREGCSKTTAARKCGVSYPMVWAYRKAHPAFAEQEEEAELEATNLIEDALFEKARGGDTTACQVWLYNRCPGRWKDQRNLKVTGLEDVLRALPPELADATRRALGEGVPPGGGEDPPGGGRAGAAPR